MGYTKRELFTRQMSRKEFLQLAGVVILGIIGVNNFVSTIKSHINRPGAVGREAGNGFGSRKFGD